MGKGRKLAWQGAWHENTKGAAQLRSFFVNVDERVWSWGMLVRSDLRIEAMYVEGGEDVFMMYCCTKRMRKFSIANMTTSDWGRFKGPLSASEWNFGSAGRSNAVQNRKRGWEKGVRAQHENEARQRWRLPMNEHANHGRRCINEWKINELKRNEACPIDDANHAEDADVADVADGVPGGDWAHGQTACEPARGEGG